MALAAGGLLATAACSDDGSDAAGTQVVTTVAPITSIVAAVGGDAIEIEGIVPEGTNSHTFEPPPSAAGALAQADVLFYNGLSLEEPVRQMAEENMGDDSAMVALGEETIGPDEYIYDFSFPEAAGNPNPHLWTNPPMAKRYAEVVRDVLVERDPDNASAYEENYEAFAAQVDALDTAMQDASATVPESQRKLLTYHDAYPYFAEHYGWEVIGAVQPAHFGEPTAQEIGALISQIEDEEVPAIFGSEVFPSTVLEQIADETGVSYVDDLRDDDLPGEPGDPEHSWLGLMQFNFVTMVRSLGGDPSALDALDLSIETPDMASYPQ